MSANGRLLDQFTRRQIFNQRFAAGLSRRSLPWLRQMALEIEAALLAADLDSGDAVKLAAALNAVQAATVEVTERMLLAIMPELLAFADAESAFARKALEGATDARVDSPKRRAMGRAVRSSKLELISGKTVQKVSIPQMFRIFARGIAREVGTSVQAGLADQKPASDIIRQASSLIRTRARAQQDTLIRTSVNHAGAVARDETYTANKGIVQAEKFVAVLDGNTTITCFPASTRVLPVGVVKNIIRAEYAGDMVTITTASGKQISGTPNHPVLTNRGTVALGELKPLDKIVATSGGQFGSVLSRDDVGVISPIGEIFDSLSQAAVFDAVWKTSSTTDLYGDGEFCNGNITVINTDCLLSDEGVPVINKRVIDNLFGSVESAVELSTLGGAFFAVFGLNPANMPAQIPVSLMQEFVDRALVDASSLLNSAGLNARIEKLKHALSILNSFLAVDAFGRALSDAELCKKAGDSGGCGIKSAGDASAGFAVPVCLDDIVEVRREFVSCHVYTLSVDRQELYIAEGFAVKNCASLDGTVHPIGEGPHPALHWGCRSIRVPLVQQGVALALPGGRRTAEGVRPVSARLTYGGWLKKQPEAVQDEVLGVERAKLFRSGKVSIQRFTDDTGKVYTLEELAKREGLALE